MLLTRTTADETATGALAASLARQCRKGDCLLLHGDLGAGKTAFARGFIQALLEHPVEITSPTFTLVQTYPTKDHGMIWHCDLYRLRAAEEVEEIGLEDAFHSAITLIEWPEIARDFLPADALNVSIAIGNSSTTREIVFSGTPALWQDRLSLI